MKDYLSDRPLVSIIIPTYNEERDILRCLQAVLDLDYSRQEVIIVDSSDDGTPALLRPFAERGSIELIHEQLNVSAARNRGIRIAKGEIIVLLNADVILDRDFIHRILHHYRQGADFVVCESRVANTEQLIPALLQAVHELEFGNRNDLVWSEGWSCRRKVLEQVGLFDESFPAAGGEDAAFGFSLVRSGFRRTQDHSIVVRHITPHTLMGLIQQMVGRGRGEYYFLVLFERKDPRPAAGLAILPWALILMLCSGIFLYPVGTIVGTVGLVMVAGRAFRTGLRLASPERKLLKIILFAALNFLRFRCKEYGFLSAYRAAGVEGRRASPSPRGSREGPAMNRDA